MPAIASSSAPRPSRKKRWLLLLAVVIVLPVAHYHFLKWRFERDLANAVAETERLDPNWRLADLEAERRTPTPNSADQVFKALGLAGTATPFAGVSFYKAFADVTPAQTLTANQADALRQALTASRSFLEAARALKDMPEGRYPPGHQQATLMKLYYALRFDAWQRAHAGDVDAAMESCAALVNAARSFGDEPSLMAASVRRRGQEIVVRTIERVLAQGEASERALREMQTQLAGEEQDYVKALRQIWRGERALGHQKYEDLRNGKKKLSDIDHSPGLRTWFASRLPLLAIQQYPDYLRLMNRLVAESELAWPEQAEKLRDLRAQFGQRAPTPGMAFDTAIVHYLVAQYLLAAPTGLADLRATQAALACERYRLEHKRWPASLAALVEAKLLVSVPIDPFDGQPLRHKRHPEGWTIYGVGEDLQDNGGVIDRARPYFHERDGGIQLWDPPRRRQAPLP